MKPFDTKAANSLATVVDGVGRMMVQGALTATGLNLTHNGPALMLPSIVTESLTISGAIISTVVGADGGATAPKVIAMPGIGTFRVSTASLRLITKPMAVIGFIGSVPVGASLSQWSGNPFGPYRQNCGNLANSTDGTVGIETTCVAGTSSRPRPSDGNVVTFSLSSGSGASLAVQDLRDPIILTIKLAGRTRKSLEDQLVGHVSAV